MYNHDSESLGGDCPVETVAVGVKSNGYKDCKDILRGKPVLKDVFEVHKNDSQ